MEDQREERKKQREQKQEERGNNKTLLQEVYENVSRETFYHPEDIKDVLELAQVEKYLIKTKGIELFNVCASFDIETYSFKDDEGKKAIMYIWMFCVNGVCIVGRTWVEFEDMMIELVNILGLYEKKQIFIYIHNLSYEFQFIKDRFTWSKVFAIEERKPVYALTDSGVCFWLISLEMSKAAANASGRQLGWAWVA